MIERTPDMTLHDWRLARVENELGKKVQRGPWDMPGLMDRMADLYEDGHPTRVIAEKLNAEFGITLTRNAIIGRSRRKRLKRVVETIMPAKVAKRIKAKSPAPQPVPERPPEGSLTFDDLALNDDCRYPFGEHKPYFYCGQPQVRGSSYCEKHDRLSRPGAYRHG